MIFSCSLKRIRFTTMLMIALSAFATDTDDLIENITDESQKTIDWLKLNQMIVNPKTCQVIFISKKKNG